MAEGVSRKFQMCFKKTSRVIKKTFISVSRKFQGCLLKVSKDVSMEIEECLEGDIFLVQGK